MKRFPFNALGVPDGAELSRISAAAHKIMCFYGAHSVAGKTVASVAPCSVLLQSVAYSCSELMHRRLFILSSSCCERAPPEWIDSLHACPIPLRATY